MRSLLHRFDAYFTARIWAWPRWLYRVMKAASFIGHPYVTLGGIATGLLMLSWTVSSLQLMYVSAGIFATHGVGSLLKLGIGRRRPATYASKRWRIKTHSFPSGHTLGSAVAYGGIALMVGSYSLIGMVGVCLLMMLVILIGISRVYLGAHYPSDVIAGWLLGGIGAVLVASWV